MQSAFALLGTAGDLLLVVLGFTLIIVLHELGHFVAARWAGIRVLAFAVGFGPAIVSYRQGLGWRRGSSAPEYDALPAPRRAAVSPTEYRWNVFPLGGYVKMLGQDDADPSARSGAPDSYQSASVPKRMVVISAGVIMNVIAAAILFVAVFMLGLRTEPAEIGLVLPGSPAATAVARQAADLGVTQPGLQPGDSILSINGEAPRAFNDLSIETAMSSPGHPLAITVGRPGFAEPLHFDIVPKEDPGSRLLTLGVGPGMSLALPSEKELATPEAKTRFARIMARAGAAGLPPGSKLVAVQGAPAGGPATPFDLDAAARAAAGAPFWAEFELPGAGGERRRVEFTPRAVLPTHDFTTVLSGREVRTSIDHLLGLPPLVGVGAVDTKSPAAAAGIQPGDVFTHVGDIPFPSLPEFIAQIRRLGSGPLSVGIRRPDPATGLLGQPTTLTVDIRGGRMGIELEPASAVSATVARWPAPNTFTPVDAAGASVSPPSGAGLGLPPGATITSVDGRPVRTLVELRDALRSLAAGAPASPAGAPLTVALGYRPPLPPGADGLQVEEETTWSIPAPEVAALAALGWESPLEPLLFQPKLFDLRADSPLGALGMGLHRTKQVMLQTYLTFARLAQGSVRVEHLKGPVGIAHVGTLLADRGFVWLLFFMGVISINLAVVNFLPLPIVDGGHFVFLLWEFATGRAVSVAVQNVATIAGLALIGTMFLVVTYNDLANLLWR